MSKTDKQLKYFVKALLKYAEKDKHFNPGFTTEQIPTIFKGWFKNWSELEFNIVHHGAGVGCCNYIGPDRYQINIAHCNELQGKFRDSNRTKWRLIIAAAAIIFTAVNGFLAYLNYIGNCNQNKSNSQHSIDNKTVGHAEPPKK
jgi:hypothetical protein